MDKVPSNVNTAEASLLAKKFLPDFNVSDLVAAAPNSSEGFWSGAPSAAESNGSIFLAYRIREPIARGKEVVISTSKDGVHFKTIQTITKESMNAESLERPTLLKTKSGKWRLYLCCASFGSKHWRVELLEADRPDGFDPGSRKVVLPGDKSWGVKDAVITQINEVWHLWACMHPLDIQNEEDRMVSRHATSIDGIIWNWSAGVALSPREGMWDQRGTRITAVHFTSEMILAFYDGRASAAENFEERTGVAVGTAPEAFTAIGDKPFVQSPNGKGLRYLDILHLADGSYRTYYEVANDDGSHELRTNHVPASVFR